MMRSIQPSNSSLSVYIAVALLFDDFLFPHIADVAFRRPFLHYLHGGIHLVVIDGVADLIRCANDEAESVALIDEIYRLAGIYRTCIAAVVHFVPNGLKLRGHFGSSHSSM